MNILERLEQIDQYDFEEEFAFACAYQNTDEIRRLAPFFDLNTIRFRCFPGHPRPLTVAADYYGSMKAIDVLLELGLVPSPYDAHDLYFYIGGDLPFEYLDYFKERGYDIQGLVDIYFDDMEKYDIPDISSDCDDYPESDDEDYFSSDGEDNKKLSTIAEEDEIL